MFELFEHGFFLVAENQIAATARRDVSEMPWRPKDGHGLRESLDRKAMTKDCRKNVRFAAADALTDAIEVPIFIANAGHVAGYHATSMSDDDKDAKDGGEGTGTGLATRTRTKTKKPSLYRVLLLNDDFTPMEFVVHVLERFFSKNREQATRIMLHVHNHGVGECGVFTFEVAETKVTQVMDFARKHQHPLQCVMEKN